jgi:transposase-like protein
MTLTTPVQERYTRFSCPNPPCAPCNRPGDGNIAPRSWTGTRTHIARLRCMACDREFSEREGTRMARSKLPEDPVIQRVQCQRWGVCDEGTADMCAVDRTTVPRLQQGAAQRAETPHRQVVRGVDVPGVQLDEAHATLRPHQGAWIHTALAMGSWLLLWVDVGPRPQEQAALRRAQVVARVRALPRCLTDGWKA